MISHFESASAFLWVSIALRFTQGLFDCVMEVTCSSMVTYTFQENIMKYNSITQIAMGIGCAGGPGLASFIFSKVGYEKTFYIFATFQMVNVVVDFFFLPEDFKKQWYDKKIQKDDKFKELHESLIELDKEYER